MTTAKCETKDGARSAYQKARAHLYRLLDNLEEQHGTFRPVLEARNIVDLCRHIINADIYWLKILGYDRLEHEPEGVSLKQVRKSLFEAESYMIETLDNLPEKDVAIIPPQGENKPPPPSLMWVVFRVSQHCLCHTAQISYLRSIQDTPPLPEEFSWERGVDSITLIIKNLLEH